MKLDLWIPQLFYDLIGRLVPGAILWFWCLLPYAPEPRFVATRNMVMNNLLFGHGYVAFLFGVAIAYVTGSVLGALWRLLDNRVRAGLEFRWYERSFLRAWTELENHGIVRGDPPTKDLVGYVYDTIQLRYPKAGARIAKLRAEQYQAGAFVIGFAVVGFVHGASICFGWSDWRVAKVLPWLSVPCVAAALFLLKCISSRAGTAVASLWALHQQNFEEI